MPLQKIDFSRDVDRLASFHFNFPVKMGVTGRCPKQFYKIDHARLISTSVFAHPSSYKVGVKREARNPDSLGSRKMRLDDRKWGNCSISTDSNIHVPG